MRRLEVVDLVALACDIWECDPDKAIERLDLSALEQSVAAAFPIGLHAGPEHLDPRGEGIEPLAMACTRLAATLLSTRAAGADTPYFALVALTCLATANDCELHIEAREISCGFTALAAGSLPLDEAARWLQAHLLPTDRPVPYPQPADQVEVDVLDAVGLADSDESRGLSRHARQALLVAAEECRRVGHPAVSTEHLLLGLTAVPGSRVTELLRAHGVLTDNVRRRAEWLVRRGTVVAEHARPLTPGAQRVLDAARQRAEAENALEVDTEHILLALLADDNGVARQILHDFTDVPDLERSVQASPSASRVARPPFVRSTATDPRFAIDSPFGVDLRGPEGMHERVLGRAKQHIRRCIVRLAPDAEMGAVELHEVHETIGTLVVDIHTRQPGLVIGHKGVTANQIRAELADLFGSDNVVLNIHEQKHGAPARPAVFGPGDGDHEPRAVETDWPVEIDDFSEHAQLACGLAIDESRRLGHPVIGTEHLLLGLLGVRGSRAAVALDIPTGRARNAVSQMVGTGSTPPDRPRPPSPLAESALERARREATRARSDLVTTDHMLLGLLGNKQSVAAQVIQRLMPPGMGLTHRPLRNNNWVAGALVMPTEPGPLPGLPFKVLAPQPALQAWSEGGPRQAPLQERIRQRILRTVRGAEVEAVQVREANGLYEVIIHSPRPEVLLVGPEHEGRRAMIRLLDREITDEIGARGLASLKVVKVHDPPALRHVDPDQLCSFCSRGVRHDIRVVVGPSQAICEECLARATQTLRADHSSA